MVKVSFVESNDAAQNPVENENMVTVSSTQDTQESVKQSIFQSTDTEIIDSLISGTYCLNGVSRLYGDLNVLETNAKTNTFKGTGWWKYEICYGKYIKQYHDVRNIKRSDFSFEF